MSVCIRVESFLIEDFFLQLCSTHSIRGKATKWALLVVTISLSLFPKKIETSFYVDLEWHYNTSWSCSVAKSKLRRFQSILGWASTRRWLWLAIYSWIISRRLFSPIGRCLFRLSWIRQKKNEAVLFTKEYFSSSYRASPDTLQRVFTPFRVYYRLARWLRGENFNPFETNEKEGLHPVPIFLKEHNMKIRFVYYAPLYIFRTSLVAMTIHFLLKMVTKSTYWTTKKHDWRLTCTTQRFIVYIDLLRAKRSFLVRLNRHSFDFWSVSLSATLDYFRWFCRMHICLIYITGYFLVIFLSINIFNTWIQIFCLAQLPFDSNQQIESVLAVERSFLTGMHRLNSKVTTAMHYTESIGTSRSIRYQLFASSISSLYVSCCPCKARCVVGFQEFLPRC